MRLAFDNEQQTSLQMLYFELICYFNGIKRQWLFAHQKAINILVKRVTLANNNNCIDVD